MADIPVRPARRGVPWWLWLLILLLVAAVAAFFFLSDDEDDDDDDRLTTDTTEVRTPDPLAGGAAPLTRLDGLPDGSAAATYAGRRVELVSARVSRVLSDSALVVEGDGGREVLVVLEEPPGASTSGSGRGFSVETGDMVRLAGTLRQAGAAMRGIPEAARAEVDEGALYVAASAFDVTPSTGAATPRDTLSTAPDTTR